MRHYCTLFDVNYLEKGLALHASLLRNSSEPFLLYILAMDDQTAQILWELELKNVQVLPLANFEAAMKMGAVKASRSTVEYFWTCASSLAEYILSNFRGLEMLTYLDADLFFFGDPRQIFDEIGGRSIAIIPHRFAEKDRARLEPNGIFNVGWVSFRADEVGLSCAMRWAEQCRQWCFNAREPGKFGDQKYLDEWPALYGDRLAVIQNLGAGLAPWNLQQYQIQSDFGFDIVSDGKRRDYFKFYHFHEYRSESDLTRWPLRQEDRELIYRPYISALRVAGAQSLLARARILHRQEEMALQGSRA